MAKARFMSMKWLRLHLKEIIWGTVILFVLSVFIIGYGTARSQKRIDDDRRKAEAEDRKARQAEEAVPENLKGKLHLPAVHVSYPTAQASLTRSITVESVFKTLLGSMEYRKLLSAPPQLRAAFGAQIKEGVLEDLIIRTLLDLYAEVNQIRPTHSPSQFVEMDRARLSEPKFKEQLKREGINELEYGKLRSQQEVVQNILGRATQAIPVASLTDDFLKKYYEEHKLAFMKDDEIEFDHLLISPTDFQDQVKVADEDIRKYFDENRAEFKSSRRLSLNHIFIDPNSLDFQKTIALEESQIQSHYTENLGEYKQEEKIQARHILFRPRNSFEKKLDTFSVNIRNFTLTDQDGGKKLYTFELGLTDESSDMKLTAADIVLVAATGNRFKPDDESMALVKSPFKLPVSGSPEANAHGDIGILLPADAEPEQLEIKDIKSTHTFAVASAHNEEKAFEKAREEAESAMARLLEGADFATLAKKLSDDIGSREEGGDLGEFGRGRMVKPFEDAAFGANIGEIKGPVKSRFGYHLIKVEKKVPSRTTPLEEVREKITNKLKFELASTKAQATLENCRELLEQKSRSFRELAEKNSMAPSRKDGGRLPVIFKGEITDDYSAPQKDQLLKEIAVLTQGEDGGLESQPRLAAEIEDEVFGLEKGQISQIIKSDKGYHLFQVESVLDPIDLGFTSSVQARIKRVLVEKREKDRAREKAAKIATEINTTNFAVVASDAAKTGVQKLGPFPISTDPGFGTYALTSAIGKISMDGRTFLPPLHQALAKVLYQSGEKELSGKIVGPVETEIGFHFVKLTTLTLNSFKPFEEVKDDLKAMLSQDPGETAIREEFERDQAKHDTPAYRKISQIVVADEPTAQEVHKRLKAGESFYLLAQNFSIDPTKVTGGAVGNIKRGHFPASVEESVWALKKHEITPPLKTSFGWVIVQLDADEIPGKKAELTKEISDQIRKQLGKKLQYDLFTLFINELKKRSLIVRHTVLAEL
jgi:parvulin-like peptidyl-prolyl isomerase